MKNILYVGNMKLKHSYVCTKAISKSLFVDFVQLPCSWIRPHLPVPYGSKSGSRIAKLKRIRIRNTAKRITVWEEDLNFNIITIHTKFGGKEA
jgi:hypothetical protein